MKKIYFLLIAFLSVLSLNVNAQADIVFSFDTDGDAEGWTSLSSDATVTVSGGLLNLDMTGKRPKLSYSAGIDADTYKYVTVILNNNSNNAFLRTFYPKIPDTGDVYVDTDITTGDSDYQTYTMNLTNADHWVGTNYEITFAILKDAAKTVCDQPSGDMDIEEIRFHATLAKAQKASWDFEDNLADGWSVVNGSTALADGKITLTPNYDSYTKLEQLDYVVDADTYGFLKLVAKNESADNDQIRVIGNGNTITNFPISVSDASFQTYIVKLDGSLDWTGDVDEVTFGIKDTQLGGKANAGDIIFESIDFIETVDVTWTGATDTDWATATNWSGGVVPMANYNVTIPVVANMPLIASSTSATCNDLTIASGSFLGLLSDASNSASLKLVGTYTGSSSDIIYSRYLADNQWHLIGAPLNGETISNAFIAANSIIGMKNYIESTDSWATDYIPANAPDVAFVSGKGYAVKINAAGSIEFTGDPVNADKYIPLTRDNNGWNLLSNPFTTAVAANLEGSSTNNILTDNAAVLDPSFTALYVWDYATASYAIINHFGGTPGVTLAQDILQVGQGFFVKSADPASETSFKLSTAAQVEKTDAAFKTSVNELASIQLIATTESQSASTRFYFAEGMTNGLDAGYDAGIFRSNPSFSLFSRLVDDNNVDFMVQALPAEYANLVIPVGIEANAGEIISFSSENTNIPEEYAVVLEDRLLGIFTDLSDGNKYTFQSTTNLSGVGRFFVHTSFKSALGMDDIDERSFQVYTRVNDHQLLVRGEATTNTVAKVYSITGKLIQETTLKNATENRIDFQADSGVYIMQITNENGNYTQKFSWAK